MQDNATMIDYLGLMWDSAINGQKQGIAFFASLYALLLLSYSVVYQLRVRAWPSAKGVLMKAALTKVAGTDNVTSNQEYAASAHYEFYVGDVAYQGRRVSPWVVVASHNAGFVLEKQLRHIRKHDDGTVDVFFNPKNPNKSFLVKPGNLGLAVTLGLAVAPMALYWFAYHA